MISLFLEKIKYFNNQILKSNENQNAKYLEKFIEELLKNIVKIIINSYLIID